VFFIAARWQRAGRYRGRTHGRNQRGRGRGSGKYIINF